MLNLYKKELNYYLNNPVGYIVIVIFAVFANFLFVKDIFLSGSASMRPFFNLLPWLLLIFAPALTMRILSEEKRTNTIEVLLTLPVTETEVIISKFLALFTLITIGLLLTFGLPISLSFLTKIYLPEILVGYIGSSLLAANFISLTMFFSCLTKNQVVAFLISALILFFMLVLGSDILSNVLPKVLLDYLSNLSPMTHLQNFIKGVIDIRSVVYFLTFSVITLFLTVVSLEKRG